MAHTEAHSTKQAATDRASDADREKQTKHHFKQIRELVRQMNNNASPSGAQTIGMEIMRHVNEMEAEMSDEHNAGSAKP